MNNKYTVAVIGTQNTGKSSFIKDIIEHYKNHPEYEPFSTNKIDYREKIQKEGLQINRNGNLRCQQIIFDTLCESVFMAIMDDSIANFISDRCPIDAYVYSVYLSRHNTEANITKTDLDKMYDKLERIMKLYDEIIYIPLEKCDNVKVVDDKFRDTNLEYRREIDDIFTETLLKLNLGSKVSTNVYGTREERVDRFETFCTNLYNMNPSPSIVRKNI